MATTDLDRLAGTSLWVAIAAFVLSAIALALFFGGAGSFWGPVNDALIVATAIALLPAVLAVGRTANVGAWVGVVTAAAIAGLVLIAIGQTLLIVGLLSLEGSYVTGGLGVIPVIAWIVAVAILALRDGALPATAGWLAVAILGLIVVLSALSAVTRGPLLWIGAIALVVVISAWLASLATTFGSPATNA